MTGTVMDAYEGAQQSNILVCEFENITQEGGMCVIKICVS